MDMPEMGALAYPDFMEIDLEPVGHGGSPTSES